MSTSRVPQSAYAEQRVMAELGDYVRDPNNRANCLGQGLTDPAADVWHHEPETTEPEARRRYTARIAAACHGCPVRSACLVYALGTEQTQAEGVMPAAYGGLPSWERAELIRRAHANGWQPVNTSMARSLLANQRTRDRALSHAGTRVREHASAQVSAA